MEAMSSKVRVRLHGPKEKWSSNPLRPSASMFSPRAIGSPPTAPNGSNRPWRGSTVRLFATISTTKPTGSRLFPASIALERQGVKIAVVGLTDIGASERQPPAEFRGMDTTPHRGLARVRQGLRSREQPDLVVGLAHTGLTIAREIARRTPEFDVILSGHTHERTAWPILEGDVIVVEPGCIRIIPRQARSHHQARRRCCQPSLSAYPGFCEPL